MDIAEENEIWATRLIDGLIQQGVDYFCCSPGSRSIPLLLAIASHPEAQKTVHFDERGLGFHAVGYAKASRRPAVVVATSGTAVGNLLPAVMEASNARVPLILLTADRPPELRDCGANQTCDQARLFQNHVRWQVDLPCPEARIHERYLASTLAHAFAQTTLPPAGPVHINCMFREPLIKENQVWASLGKRVVIEQPVLHPTEDTLKRWAQALSLRSNGVIIAGSDTIDYSAALFALGKRLQWPVFADVLSPLRSHHHSTLIPHFDPILKVKPSVRAEAILQFGDRFCSKILAQWLENQSPEFFLHVADHPLRQDPSHLITHRHLACPNVLIEGLLSLLDPEEDDTWLSHWREWDAQCRETLASFFSGSSRLTEPGVIREIASFLTKEWALFLANSMPIRDANQFFVPMHGCGPIYGNRGVSGIDGNIATAAGIAAGCKKPTLAVLGDLAFLHDLNSLASLHRLEYPVILCVINNGGGGIFSFLPVAKRKEAFEEMIATSHTLTFASAAELFQIPWYHPDSPSELGALLHQVKKHPRSCLIEITTDRNENVRIHEHIMTAIRSCLHPSQPPAEIPAFLH